MKTFLSVVAALAALVMTVNAEPTWSSDYKQSQEKAKQTQKLVLLDFTGSDWCGWCIRLHKEVFSQPEFTDYADKNLVLVELDFPRRKPLTDEVKKQNAVLAAQYQIEGYPTIIVLNGDGKKVGELGYMEGGPKAFIAELEKLRKG